MTDPGTHVHAKLRRAAANLRLVCLSLAVALSLCSSAAAASPFWHTAYPSTDGFSLNDVSCATPTLCIAVGGSGEAVGQDGDYQYETRPESVPTFNAVSCAPGTRFCMAADNQGNVVPWRDGEFGAVDSIDDDFEFQAVSCPTAAFCMAIDREDVTFRYADGVWTKLPLSNKPAAGVYANSNRVSCSSPTFCVALTGATSGMRYATWNGTAWTNNTSTITGEAANPKSLTCTSQSFCLVTTSAGNADRFNGTSWSVKSVSTKQLWAGCAGTTCQAIDQNVRGYSTLNGSDWSAPTDLKVSTNISIPSSVMCVASDLCVATSGSLTTTLARSIIPDTHPVLSGAATVGARLTLTHAPVDETRAWYVDQWFRCGNPGSNTCVQIEGVKGTSYTLTAADAGKYIEARDITGIGLDQEGATLVDKRTFISNAIQVEVPLDPVGSPTPGGSAAPAGPTPTAAGPAPAPPAGPAAAPVVKPARLLGGKLVLTKLSVALTKGARCPKSASITITSGSRHATKKVSVRSAGAGCAITATVKLSGKLAKVKKVSLTITGKGLKKTKVSASAS